MMIDYTVSMLLEGDNTFLKLTLSAHHLVREATVEADAEKLAKKLGAEFLCLTREEPTLSGSGPSPS